MSRVLLAAALLSAGLLAAASPAAAVWAPRAVGSGPMEHLVAAGSASSGLLAWRETTRLGSTVRVRDVAPDSTPGPERLVPGVAGDTWPQDAALTDDGHGVLCMERSHPGPRPSRGDALVSVRAPGGGFGRVRRLGSGREGIGSVRCAIAADGTAVVAWSEAAPANAGVRVRVATVRGGDVTVATLARTAGRPEIGLALSASGFGAVATTQRERTTGRDRLLLAGIAGGRAGAPRTVARADSGLPLDLTVSAAGVPRLLWAAGDALHLLDGATLLPPVLAPEPPRVVEAAGAPGDPGLAAWIEDAVDVADAHAWAVPIAPDGSAGAPVDLGVTWGATVWPAMAGDGTGVIATGNRASVTARTIAQGAIGPPEPVIGPVQGWTDPGILEPVVLAWSGGRSLVAWVDGRGVYPPSRQSRLLVAPNIAAMR